MARWGSEADLQGAIDDGSFHENHYLEAKRELGTTKSSNVELAKDVAQFAIDGGALVIGVEEDKATQTFSLRPFELVSGFAEKVESIAHDRCQPPLSVRTTEIPSVLEPGKGYLVVEVEPSPVAPHQVDGRYYGRASTQKQVLGDSEVRLRLKQREDAAEAGLAALKSFMAQDPIVKAGGTATTGHLFVTLVPLDFAGRAQLDGRGDWLREQIARRESSVLGLDPTSNGLSWLVRAHQRQQGVAVTSQQVNYAGELQQAASAPIVELELTRQGHITFFRSELLYPSTDLAEGVRCVRDRTVMRAVEQLLPLAVAWADEHEYRARWAIGFAATGLTGTVCCINPDWNDYGSVYPGDALGPHVVLTTTRTLVERPREVIRDLVADFLRVYGLHAYDRFLWPVSEATP